MKSIVAVQLSPKLNNPEPEPEPPWSEPWNATWTLHWRYSMIRAWQPEPSVLSILPAWTERTASRTEVWNNPSANSCLLIRRYRYGVGYRGQWVHHIPDHPFIHQSAMQEHLSVIQDQDSIIDHQWMCWIWWLSINNLFICYVYVFIWSTNMFTTITILLFRWSKLFWSTLYPLWNLQYSTILSPWKQ